MKKYRLPAVLLIAIAFALSAFDTIADTDTGFTSVAASVDTMATAKLKLTDNVTPMRSASNGLPSSSGECVDTDIVTCNSDSIGEDATRWPWPPTPVPANLSCNSCHALDTGVKLRPG